VELLGSRLDDASYVVAIRRGIEDLIFWFLCGGLMGVDKEWGVKGFPRGVLGESLDEWRN
jgi:hypothetical protein